MTQFKQFGKYTIIKKLASGGMADILLASDLSPTGFGRFVVIKRALSKFSDNEEFKDMFKNEGKVACNLKHRNITPIYEFGIEKNQFFLSMEYISGRNLREFIKKLQSYKGSIDIPNAVHITKEVASGLNYAHNAIDSNTGQPLNLIHRDISPQNIMLSFDGEIKLIDFGIAKISDTNLTRAGHLKGKFSYMSPEQAHGMALDERTDIFCLGIILWEMLTNKRLFASKNELDSLKKIKNCDIPSAQKINPQIPTELNNIVKKALSKNKNSRYKTAAKLEQDLNIFLNKTYPEYSHYDFISMMKTTYRKVIMEEREKLKSYSSEFKKYLNTLNIEESIKSNIDLNIPDLSTLIEIDAKQQTKSLIQKRENELSGDVKSLSEYAKHASTKTVKENRHPLDTNSQIRDKSTTLIQKKESETYTKGATATQKTVTVNTHPTQHIVTAKINLKNDLVQSQVDFLKNMQKTKGTKTHSSTIYNKQEFLADLREHSTTSRKRKMALLLPLMSSVLLISGMVTALYWLGKDNHSISDFFNDKLISFFPEKPGPVVTDHQATLTEEPFPPPRPEQHDHGHSGTGVANPDSSNQQQWPDPYPLHFSNKEKTTALKKIFIRSTPSGAEIYINNKFSLKHTPSFVNLIVNQSSDITLKKKGYFPTSMTFDPGRQNKRSLNITLKADFKRNISSETIHIIQ